MNLTFSRLRSVPRPARAVLAAVAACLALAACGGSSSDPIPDTIKLLGFDFNPVSAGLTDGVASGTVVSVRAIAVSTGNISNGDLSYAWTQKSGTTVALRNATTSTMEITTPVVSSKETLVFEVKVSGRDKSVSEEATVVVKP